MDSQKLKVLVYRKGFNSSVEMIENTLESFQSLVGGNIEGWMIPWREYVQLICYELGRFERPANRYVHGLGEIHGTFLISRIDRRGESVSLTDEDVNACRCRIPS